MLPLYRNDKAFKDHPSDSQGPLSQYVRFLKVQWQIHPLRTTVAGLALFLFCLVLFSGSTTEVAKSDDVWADGGKKQPNLRLENEEVVYDSKNGNYVKKEYVIDDEDDDKDGGKHDGYYGDDDDDEVEDGDGDGDDDDDDDDNDDDNNNDNEVDGGDEKDQDEEEEREEEDDAGIGNDIDGGKNDNYFNPDIEKDLNRDDKNGDNKEPVTQPNQDENIGHINLDIQYDPISNDEAERRRTEIKKTFLTGWGAYKKYAFGHDELNTDTCSPAEEWMGMGLTIVDGLDTLWIMDEMDEFAEGRDWIANNIKFIQDRSISFFETTIRILGGLLSAYDLSKERVFLDKAILLADRLLYAFNTTSGIPHASINLKSLKSRSPSWTSGSSILSEVGTVQLEFGYLSRVSGDMKYAEKALKVYDILDNLRVNDGLYPIYINPDSGTFTSSHVSMGAMGDSLYEYFLKVYIQTKDKKYLRLYQESTKGIQKHLLKKSHPNNLLYFAEYNGHSPIHKMDELACFAGGMFGLGSQFFEEKEEHMKIAQGITETCHQMFTRQKTKLAPDYVQFEGADDFRVGAGNYVLRPETFESYFVLWRLTHDPKYRHWGWEAYQAIEKHCKSECGYSGLKDVTLDPPPKDDKMQSFLFAETLKYLYLLFSPDDVIPLDKYVFNTEGHPTTIFDLQ